MESDHLLSALARRFPPDRLLTHAGRAGALRIRRPDDVPRPAARRRPARIAATRSSTTVRLLPRGRRPLHGPRQRHQPVGRRGAGRRRDRHRAQPAESDPAPRSGGPPRRRRAGRDQPRRHGGGGAARSLLRPGSVEPVDLHDRRQRRVQLGRRALLPARDDGESRPRPEGGAARRDGRRAWRRERRTRRPRSGRPVRRIRRAVRHRDSRSRCG